MTAQAGELEELGFEEVEPGLVEDTAENRRRIYKLEGNWQFERILDEDGMPTGLIRPLPLATLTARREKPHDVYRPMLVEPDNPWSDYRGPDDWPMDAYAPAWVLARAASWFRREAEGVPEDKRKPFPRRCEHVRHDGTRCWMWNRGDVPLCAAHARSEGKSHSRMAMVAKLKLLEMAPDMADTLEYLATHAAGEAVRLKAATEILDRAGVRGGVEIDLDAKVEVQDTATLVKERLAQLALRADQVRELEERRSSEEAEVVEAEVVSDDAE